MENLKENNYKYYTNHAEFTFDDYEKEELKPIYDDRKSFYKKAYVIYLSNNVILLQSYNTIVAHIENGVYTNYGKFSQTTTRHQKEFEKQFSK